MNRIYSSLLLLLAASVAIVGGCVHQTKSSRISHYSLGGAVPAPASSAAAGNPSGQILQVSRITVPDWLADNAMYYRLDYRHDGRLAAYAESE